jgi:hypothetical protein
MALFIFFVRQDEPALSTGPALLIDNLLRAASLLALASVVILLIAQEDIAQRASAVASITVLALSGAVITSGIWSPRRDSLMVALAVLATVLAAYNIWLQREAGSGLKTTATKNVAALLAIAAVPAFTFWAETSYLPSRNSVTLLGAIEVDTQRAPDMSLHLQVSSTVENPSDVKAQILMSDLQVCSFLDEDELNSPSDPDSADAGHCVWLPQPLARPSWLDPGASATIRRSVTLDPERPLVQVQLRWWYARADRLILGSQETVTDWELGDCSWVDRWHIRAQSRLSSLALKELSLVYAPVDGGGALDYFIVPTDDFVCNHPDLRAQLQQYLALTWELTVWEGWPIAPAEID